MEQSAKFSGQNSGGHSHINGVPQDFEPAHQLSLVLLYPFLFRKFLEDLIDFGESLLLAGQVKDTP